MPNQPNVTGLSALGEAISNGTRDYANLEVAQRLRDEQRAYNERESDKQRKEHLQDAQRLELMRARTAGLQVLINENLLDPNKIDDQQAVQAAFEEAQRRGIDKLYNDLLTTPGSDGKPLITEADLSNPAKVQAAKDALGAIKAKQLQFSMGQHENAQSTVDAIAGRLGQRQARIADLSGKLDAPAPQYGLNDPQVQALAVQLAEQAKPGSGKNMQAVSQMLPDAQKMLNDQALVAHAQQLQSVREQLTAERYAEASDTNALDHAMQVGKVFPSKGATISPSILRAPSAAAPKVATPEQIAAAMRAALGANGGGAPSGSVVVPTNADPETQNYIAEQNRAKAAMDAQQILAPLISREAQIQSEINDVKSAPDETPAPQAIDSELGWMNLPTGSVDQKPYKAKKLSSLYLELKNVQDQKAKLKAQQLGVSQTVIPPTTPISSAASASMFNNPSPVFTQKVPAYASPSALQLPSWFSADSADQ